MAKVAPSAMPGARGIVGSEAREQTEKRRAEWRADPAHASQWHELDDQERAKVELSALMPEAQKMDVSMPAGRKACIGAYDGAAEQMEVSHV